MALTGCPDCKREAFTEAEFCPHCGRSSGKRQIVDADFGVWQGFKLAFGFILVPLFILSVLVILGTLFNLWEGGGLPGGF